MWALALMIGVFLSSFRNQFVTKTFPNHWSIVTGVYEEVHGLVGNTVYDKALNVTRNITDHALFSQNPSITPIWVRRILCVHMHLLKSCSFSFQGNSYLFSPSRYSHYYQVQYNTSIVVCCFLNLVYSLQTLNEQQGGHSGCIMWPGCSFSYHGINVTHIERFKPNSNLRDKVDTAVKWMTHSYPQANLVMIYHDQPDQFGHVYGPNSPHVLEELKKVRCLP